MRLRRTYLTSCSEITIHPHAVGHLHAQRALLEDIHAPPAALR
jgi:hypothetical protein